MSLEYIDAQTGLPLLEKTVNETRRYYMDFTEKLRNSSLQSVSSATAVPLGRITSAVAVSVSATSLVGDSVSFTLSGGSPGEVYRVVVIVTDTTGLTLEGSGALLVTAF